MKTYLGMYEIHIENQTFHDYVIVKAVDEDTALAVLRSDEMASDHFYTQAKMVKEISSAEGTTFSEKFLLTLMGD